MKKYFSMTVVILMVLGLSLTDAAAQPFGKGKANMGATKGSKFVDANNDGVCDNYSSTNSLRNQTAKLNFVDANGDGVCDNTGTGTGTGTGKRNQGKNKPNFVDANGDGVCDNPGTGTGTGKRNQGKTRPNFIDEDGDGICDNLKR